MEDTSSESRVFDAWKASGSGTRVDIGLTLIDLLQGAHPGHHLTRVTHGGSCDLLGFAKAGHAVCTLDVDGGYVAERRVSGGRPGRTGQSPVSLVDETVFASYAYSWGGVDYIVYDVTFNDASIQNTVKHTYVLAPLGEESTQQHHPATDALLLAVGKWSVALHEELWVFDNGMWSKSKSLYKAVQHASWDDVVLDPVLKDGLTRDVHGFFDSKAVYAALRVPWKRGVIMHGEPGNGKTMSLKAIVASLAARRPAPVPALYVKSFDACAGPKWSIKSIFAQARVLAPCVLILEDLDSLVADESRSYFLNEVDGLESNDGILIIGSTNHLDGLDDAITKRPSRFDRKYHFQLPDEAQRVEYCRYWSRKFAAGQDDDAAPTVDFPDELCGVIAKVTEGYSFAYLKELFITSLLALARGGVVPDGGADAAIQDVAASDSGSDMVMVIVADTADTADTDENTAEKSKDEEEGAGEKKDKAGEDGDKKKVKKPMPHVDIPEGLRDNSFLKVVMHEARILWDQMDNSGDELVEKKKAETGNSNGSSMRFNGADIARARRARRAH